MVLSADVTRGRQFNVRTHRQDTDAIATQRGRSMSALGSGNSAQRKSNRIPRMMRIQATTFNAIRRLRHRRAAAASRSACSSSPSCGSVRRCRSAAAKFPTRGAPESSGLLLPAGGKSGGMRATTCIIQPRSACKEQTPGSGGPRPDFGRCSARHSRRARTVAVAMQHESCRLPARAWPSDHSAQINLTNSGFYELAPESQNGFFRTLDCAHATKPKSARCKAAPMGA